MNRTRIVAANTRTFSGTLPVIIESVRAAGFNGLELWKEDVQRAPGGAAEVRGLLDAAGLGVSAFQLLRDFEGGGVERVDAALAEAEELMDLMAQLGSDMLLVCSSARTDSSGDRRQQVEDLRKLADMAAARHMRIGFEPLAWSRWINDYESAFACVESADHPALGVTLDMFHLFMQRTPLEFLDRMPIEKCFGVQLCNAVPTALPPIEVARHHRLFPAGGAWPVAEVVRRLEARGYDGFYSIEVFNDEYLLQDPFEVARNAWQSWQQLIVRA